MGRSFAFGAMRVSKWGVSVALGLSLTSAACAGASDLAEGGSTSTTGATDASVSGGSAPQGSGGAGSGGGATQSQGGVGSGGAPSTGSAPHAAGSKIWTSSITSLEILRFGTWEGLFGYRRSVEQLSAEQLALLQALEVVPTTEDCSFDSSGAWVSVGDERGELAKYTARSGDAHCAEALPAVAWDGVRALISTIVCLSGRYPEKSQLGEDAPPLLTPGDGCVHGVFNTSDVQGPWAYQLDVEAGSAYRISVEQCLERQLTLAIVDENEVVQEATLDGSGECPALEFMASGEAGTYFELAVVGGANLGAFLFSVNPLD